MTSRETEGYWDSNSNFICVMSVNVRVLSQILGKIVGPKPWEEDGDDPDKTWLEFVGVDGLAVTGSGEIDGQGAAWWKSCPMVRNHAYLL